LQDIIRLYSVPNCENCKKVKSYLDDRNIKYVEYNLRKNREARKYYQSLNIETAPVIVGMNNGEEWIITGYDKEAMELLIGDKYDKVKKRR